jgi:hypothetical protein
MADHVGEEEEATEFEPVRQLNARSRWHSTLVCRDFDLAVELRVPSDPDFGNDEAAFRKAVETFRPHPQLAPALAIDFDVEPARVRYAVEGGQTLRELKHRCGRVGERETFAIGLQLATALAPLTDAGLVLGHLTADTIWVGNSGKVALLFAGTARVAERLGYGMKHQHRASTDWSRDHARCNLNGQAPEEFSFAPTPEADIFRLGVVLHDCLSGGSLFHRDDFFSEGMALRAPVTPAVSGSCDSLLSAMLQRAPEDRPSVAQVTAQLAVLLADDPRAVVRSWVERLAG